MTWVSRVLAVLGLVIVGGVLVTAFPAVVHGQWAYAALLVLTVLGCVWALLLHRRDRPALHGWRRAGSIALCVGAVGWLAAVAWLRPFSAQEPAIAAMGSGAGVVVTESSNRVVLEPAEGPSSPTSVFFQPGAKVEARAYAAVLRPLAEAGYRVVIVKQPLGIAFLSLGAFDDVRSQYPDVEAWVLGGHSLGGTVASIQANDNGGDVPGSARGLLLYASYPASDLSGSLQAQVASVFGTLDGLATAEDIAASRADLPAGSQFVPIEGAVHAFFGDYGPQPGDGEPTISHDEARTQIGNASVEFVSAVAAAAVPG
jgi:pimeloyl-ACP methyl ester carboxylesterase